MKRIFWLSARNITFLIAAASLLIWPISFSRFLLASREAYAGIGTELIAMRGVLVFYRFNNYTREPPDQNFAFNVISISSRMGQRLVVEFDTDAAPRWWNRRGFLATYGPFYGPDSSVVIAMAPLWLIGLLFATPTLLWWYRRCRSKPAANHEKGGPDV